jgi:beta-N-acetylhexosaminidase
LSGVLRLLGAVTFAAALAGVPSAATTGRAATAPTLSQLAGQTILARMRGTTPSAAFLRRVRLGQVGGIVLYSDNYGAAGPRLLVARLQKAARAGGQPPLLIAIDQEGGIVKRLAGAPTLAPPQMRTGAVARAQGLATARTLLQNGVDVDLAPVCDVGRGGFITPRAFGATPAAVAARCPAFAQGLAQGGVGATAKHFPGLGYAATTTDTGAITVTASHARLEADLLPFKAAVAAHVPLVMVSTAVYTALDRTAPAALSKPIVQGLLRESLGFHGVVITDALDTPAVARYASTGQAAVRALAAGADEVIAAGDTPTDADAVSTAAYNAVLAAARSGTLPRAQLQASYRRILTLKQSLAH